MSSVFKPYSCLDKSLVIIFYQFTLLLLLLLLCFVGDTTIIEVSFMS